MEDIAVTQQYDELLRQMQALATEEKKRVLSSFFKTAEGEYGAGDRFLGITVPLTRSVAKKCAPASFDLLHLLLQSEWHEMRFLSLLLLEKRMKQAKKTAIRTTTVLQQEQQEIFDFYLAHTHRINNWDLVDFSAPAIVGEFLLDKTPDKLFELAQSSFLWEQRISIVATLSFIRKGQCEVTYQLARRLLHHKHDLIQKAVGWMLREAGKQNRNELDSFLQKYAEEMPRTMLRYAIEKHSEKERKMWLAKGKCGNARLVKILKKSCG